MTTYYLYEIETLQPLKAGGTGSQADNELGLDYIAGSMIRGAWIAEYLAAHPGLELHADPLERRRWLAGGIRFLNGYPVIGRERAWPFPTSLHVHKDQYKLFGETGVLENPCNDLTITPGEGMKRLEATGFVKLQDGEALWVKPEMTAQLHINLQRKKTALYRYEALSPGQRFMTYVAVDDATPDLDDFFLSFRDRIIYLGGARSSGYGRCRVVRAERLQTNPEWNPSTAEEFQDELFVYALSDLIVRDENGRLVPYIPAEMIANRLGVDVELQSSSVQTTLTSGFNAKWGSRVPQLQIIRKGSVFRYRLSGKPDIGKLREWANRGIGERRADGFGRIAFLPRLDIRRIRKMTADEPAFQSDVVVSSLSDPDRRQVEQIALRIERRRIRERMATEILNWQKQTTGKAISTSQLAKWMNLLAQARNVEPEQGKQMIRRYVKHLTVKKDKSGEGEQTERSNRRVYNMLRNAKIGGRPWLDVMTERVERSDDPAELYTFLNLQPLRIPGLLDRPLLTGNEAYVLNMEMLYAYVRECRLGRSGRGERG